METVVLDSIRAQLPREELMKKLHVGEGSPQEDWPIQQQVPLFKLLGETESTVGVKLTDSLLMVPTKSVSGIRFGAETSFESCMLCPRPVCQNRRAPYDAALLDSRYRRPVD